MIKIDKNVPVPKILRGGAVKYPFAQMQVGDSIFLEGQTTNKASALSAYWRRKFNWVFIARGEKNGARIWRIR